MNLGGLKVLQEAATLALAAPSIFNTLQADRGRQLPTVDPDGRLLTISCGVALHHALVGLAGLGFSLLLAPEAADPDLLAEVRLNSDETVGQAQPDLRAAIARRHTDRRAYRQVPIPLAVVAEIVAACEQQGGEALRCALASPQHLG